MRTKVMYTERSNLETLQIVPWLSNAPTDKYDTKVTISWYDQKVREVVIPIFLTDDGKRAMELHGAIPDDHEWNYVENKDEFKHPARLVMDVKIDRRRSLSESEVRGALEILSDYAPGVEDAIVDKLFGGAE